MRRLVLIIVLLASSTAWGQAIICYSSERFGSQLVKTGDSERGVIELEPDREVRLETRFGGTAGWRYDFYKRDRTIQIYVRSGVVVRICRVPD